MSKESSKQDKSGSGCLTDIKVMQAAVDYLAGWHRESLVSGTPTVSRYFRIEATPHLVLSDSDAKRLALWEALGGEEPPEDLADLQSARCGFEVIEHVVSQLHTGLPFAEATREFLLTAVDAVTYHPETSLGFAVVHITTPPGADPGIKCLVSKLFINGYPNGSTRVEYWDTACPETGLTSYPWDAPLTNHKAFDGYIPSPYYSTTQQIVAWGE